MINRFAGCEINFNLTWIIETLVNTMGFCIVFCHCQIVQCFVTTCPALGKEPDLLLAIFKKKTI